MKEKRFNVLNWLKQSENKEESPTRNKKKMLGNLFVVFFCLFYLFIYSQYTLVKVSGLSMFPTLQEGEILLMKKTKDVKNQDIIVFNSPYKEESYFIKRVIASEGDNIEYRNEKVYLNKKELNEPYLYEQQTIVQQIDDFTVENQHVLVLGDNRNGSGDSRDFGTINTKEVLGKVIFSIKMGTGFKENF